MEQLQKFYVYAYEAGSLGHIVCGGLNNINPKTLQSDTALALYKTLITPMKDN